MSKSTIEKLESKIEKLKEERSKYKKKQENQTRQLKAARKQKNFSKYQTHSSKERYFKDLIDDINIEIAKTERLVDEEKYKIERETYRETLRAFDRMMYGKLKEFLTDLNNILADKPFNSNIGIEVYDAYVKNYSEIKKEDLEPYEKYLIISTLNTRFNVVTEWLVIANDAGSLALRNGIRADKVLIYGGLLKRQVLSCIEIIEKRLNKPGILQKVRGALSEKRTSIRN